MASEPPVTLRHLFGAFLRSRATIALHMAELEHQLVQERERATRWRRKYRRLERATHAGEGRIGR